MSLIAEHLIGIFKNVLLKSHNLGRKKKMMPKAQLLYAAAAKSLQLCPTLCDPIDGSPSGSPSLGFSRQEHWSGLPFSLQCMKVKIESEVTEMCPTPNNPVDCSLPGSSVHGLFQAKMLDAVFSFRESS